MKEGDVLAVAAWVEHSFKNKSSQPCLVRVTLQPGNRDFEEAMLIYYGLQKDGLLSKSGTPKSILDLAIFLELNNSQMNGSGKMAGYFFHAIAQWAVRQGRLDSLRSRHSIKTPLKHAVKVLIPFMMLSFLSLIAFAQSPLSQNTQVEIGLGYARPFLSRGQELIRAQGLRDRQESYFENAEGIRKNVGKYPNLSGYAFTIGFYKPIRKVNGLMLGAVVRNTQTGSQPEDGGYEEAYYFNFISAGAAAKYYPFVANHLFVKGEFGLAAVLTKNRFENSQGAQNFFHQFGIGSAGGLGTGYAFTPFADQSRAIELQAVYQLLSTRVEVNGIGDDRWRFGALQLSVTLIL